MGVPVLDTSTLRLEKSQCVAREQDRLVKDPRDRQTGCQQGESLGGITRTGREQGEIVLSGENGM